MAVETIRPTTNAITDPTVTDPENAYNGNTGNFAKLAEINEGQRAKMTAQGCPADTNPAGRTSVIFFLVGSWGSNDTLYDYAQFFFRKNNSTAWTRIYSDQPVVDFPLFPSMATLQLDVTALAGSEPSTNWGLTYDFFNGGVSDPTPPSGA